MWSLMLDSIPTVGSRFPVINFFISASVLLNLKYISLDLWNIFLINIQSYNLNGYIYCLQYFEHSCI